MRRAWPFALLLPCLGGSLVVLANPAATPIGRGGYAVTDLGALRLFPHSHGSRPAAVNDNGQVALNTVNGGQAYATIACLWNAGRTTRVTDFPAQVKDVEDMAGFSATAFPVFTQGVRLNTFPTGPWSEAFGLNNKGQVVGTYYTSVIPWERAFVFEKGRRTLLPAPAGANAHAFGINAAGQIVGRVDLPGGIRHAVLWTHQKPAELPTLGGEVSEARAISAAGVAAGVSSLAINTAGVAVGMSSLADGSQHAAVWERGKIRDIHPPGFTGSEASALNDKGQIVGTVTLADGSRHACVWTAGKVTDLGTLGGKNSQAEGINNVGQVVGSADIGTKVEGYNEVPHAFVWDAKNGLRDLNSLLSAPLRSDLWGASGINNKGQIVAYMLFGHAQLLTPTSKTLSKAPAGQGKKLASASNTGGN